jgi:hypothetical protein
MIPCRLIPLLGSNWTPYSLPNIAARYDVSDLSSLIYDGSNRVGLYSDKSGNSAENCLVLNGVAGNYASRPDAAVISILGDIDLRIQISTMDLAPSEGALISHGGSGNRAYTFYISAGTLRLFWTTDGSTLQGNQASSVTLANGLVAGQKFWARVTLDVDNGAGASEYKYYTSLDGVAWTQLGVTRTEAVSSIFNSTAVLEVGSRFIGTAGVFSGNIYRAQIRNGIDGAIVFDADFTQVAKLAGSFTESSSNAATVTINASGDTGARICGARDLFQLTTSKKAILTQSGAGNYTTYDNINDFSKSAPYSANQPRTRITVFSVPAWTSGDVLWDGNSAGSAKFYQVTGTPRLTVNAGSDGPSLTTFVLGDVAVAVEVINGASSSLARNLDEPATGDPGAGNPGGTTIAADGAGSNVSGLIFRERIEFSVALDRAPILRIARFLKRKWNIAA